jgi:hypothetical protein
MSVFDQDRFIDYDRYEDNLSIIRKRYLQGYLSVKLTYLFACLLACLPTYLLSPLAVD